MQIYHSVNEWRSVRESMSSHLSLGFVPTMGNLHAGHASLMSASQRENDHTLVSIFVNPTQFNQQNDFQNYPRTLENDLELLEKQGVYACLLPDEKTMYADGYRYQVTENKRSLSMEGAHRPGHFTGVLTIVMKLLNLTQPTRCYLGEKDYQQYQLIRDMAAAFCMPVEIKMCPTIRENSGLAFSSRNNRLTAKQKILAEDFAKIFHTQASCEQIILELTKLKIKIDYIEEHDNRRFAAVYIGGIRLIDNYALTVNK
jgi:pantoate--beta-alanine ligase